MTIDDVRYVLDCGRAKEMSYDASRGLSVLADAWVSRAAAKQRRGRAGRTAPGACFALFSRKTAANLAPQQLPEMLRTPLQQLCLSIKAGLVLRTSKITGGGCGLACCCYMSTRRSLCLDGSFHGLICPLSPSFDSATPPHAHPASVFASAQSPRPRPQRQRTSPPERPCSYPYSLTFSMTLLEGPGAHHAHRGNIGGCADAP